MLPYPHHRLLYVKPVTALVVLLLTLLSPRYAVAQQAELQFLTSFSGITPRWANATAIDANGDVILVGAADRFFQATDVIDGSNHVGGFGQDGVILKLDGESGEVLYSALFGGSGQDLFNDIEIDASGNLYLTGFTESTDFPTMNATQAESGGSDDAFLTILSATGTLLYGTYLGGSDRDWGEAITIDGAGNVFVVGRTSSSDFPTVAPYQAAFGGGASFPSDLFAVRYNPDRSVGFATYLGGSRDEDVCGIGVNVAGELTIGGDTDSEDYPVANAQQATFAGGSSDMMVTTFNPSGSSLVYSTYAGGSEIDWCNDFALKSDGAAILVGGTTSSGLANRSRGNSARDGSQPLAVVAMADVELQLPGVNADELGPISEFSGVAVSGNNDFYVTGTDDEAIWVLGETGEGDLGLAADVWTGGHVINSINIRSGRLALGGAFWDPENPSTPAISAGLFNLSGGLLEYAHQFIESTRESFCPPSLYPASMAWLDPTPLAPGDKVESGGDSPFSSTLEYSGWLGYVQCHPSLLYGQKSAAVLINEEMSSGSDLVTEVHETNAPIRVNDQFFLADFTERLESDFRTDSNEPSFVEIQDGNTITDEETSPAAPLRVCAILVRAEGTGEADSASFENSAEILRANITGEKLGPQIDPANITELIEPSQQDIIDAIQAQKGNCDELYFYYVGHGFKGGMALDGAGTDIMSWVGLSDELYKTDVKALRVILEACHSGAAVKWFRRNTRYDKTDVTVVTASSADKSTFAQNQLDANGGVKSFTGSFTYWLMRGFGNPEADTNGDNKTSLVESFQWMLNENPLILTTEIFAWEQTMKEATDPQILTNERKKADTDNISFQSSGVEVSQITPLDPTTDLSFSMASGVAPEDRDETMVTRLSTGRHWIMDAVVPAAGFEMDITFLTHPGLDIEPGEGEVLGLAVRPVQDPGSGNESADLWEAYTPTVWDPVAGRVTALGVTMLQEYALAVTVGAEVVSVEEELPVAGFGLVGAYPNPFLSSIHLSYELAERGPVQVSIFDMVGRLVQPLVDTEQGQGLHEVTWDGRGPEGGAVSSGIYLVRIQAAQGTHTRTIAYLK